MNKKIKFEEKQVRGLQVLLGALGMGVFLFLVVVLFLYFQKKGAVSSDQVSSQQLVQLLSAIHGLFFLSASGLVTFLLKKMLAPEKIASLLEKVDDDLAGEKVMGHYSSVMILCSAIMEGAALLGLVTCLLAVLQGVIYIQPAYWLNVASTLIFFVYLFKVFPTGEKVFHDLMGGLEIRKREE